MKSLKISFKPKQATKSLLLALKDRSRDILERRYGLLNQGSERMTLEAIGATYDITRERVRQIENAAIETIRKSDAYKKLLPVFDDLEDAMIEFGGLVKEEDFLNEISKEPDTRNHTRFLLTVGEPFTRIKEDDHYHHRWTNDIDFAEKIHQSLTTLYQNLSEEEIISETEMLTKFLGHLKEEVAERATEELSSRWLRISKHVSSNPLGGWGLAHSPNIRTRGIRDLAFLVMRKNAKPMHFSEVAREISNLFAVRAHVATCHNELIKDDRFVLVGRGLYALTEWGYSRGVVRDVIKSILKKDGPLTKDEVVSEVKKQRHVRENTIYVNLQNSRYFKKNKDGKYALA